MFRYSIGRTFIRRFSTAAEKTTDEKAAELGSHYLPWFKKYSFVIVPAALLTVVSVDIINNVYHRHLLEGVLPSFVNLVREHYGFDDEDADERERIRVTRERLSRPENVVVQFSHSGERVEVQLVSGSTSSRELESQIRVKLTKDQQSSFTMHNVSFDDIVEEVNVGTTASDEIPPVLVTGIASWLSNMWDEDCDSAESIRNKQIGYLRLGRPFDFPDARIMNVKFRNFLAHSFAGLNMYREIGNERLGLKGTNAKVRTRQVKTKTTQVNPQRYEALEAIKRIERQIQQFEHEKRMGQREIDAVEHDIACKRREITDIRRKHLNYFYYF